MAEILYKELSYQLTGAIFNVSHEMGPGLLEKCYQEALEIELNERNIPFEREKRIDVYYHEHKLNTDYIADFIVDNKIVVELKSVSELCDAHRAQLLNYLKLTKCKLGYLVNFHNKKADIERITNY